jgi:hypothetical protein
VSVKLKFDQLLSADQRVVRRKRHNEKKGQKNDLHYLPDAILKNAANMSLASKTVTAPEYGAL